MPAIFDRTTRNAMKREAFLQVAARLFNERGYGGISLGEIAEALGVTRGAFYYHFPDKEALLAECFDRSWRAVQEAFDEAEARGDDPRAALYSALLRVVYQQASGMTVMMRKALLGALPNAGQMKIKARQAGVQRRIEALLDVGEALRAEEAKLAFAALFYRGGYALAAASLFDAWPAADSPHAVARGFLAPLMLGLDA
jgi:AcrR family transcriptional regulator